MAANFFSLLGCSHEFLLLIEFSWKIYTNFFKIWKVNFLLKKKSNLIHKQIKDNLIIFTHKIDILISLTTIFKKQDKDDL